MAPSTDFKWELRDHSLAYVFDEDSGTYDRDYALAHSLEVELSSAGTSLPSGDRVISELWEITGVDDPSFHRVVDAEEQKVHGTGAAPPAPVTVVLPGARRYRVTLTVTTAESSRMSTERIITPHDLLVASLGDSLASGEGNPDVPDGALLDNLRGGDVGWANRRCHRSDYSCHALAARALVEPHRSVTFLPFACSGAQTEEGLLSGYRGEEPPEGKPELLPGQIDALARTGTDRVIDILLITVGVDDLGIDKDGFSSVVEAFAGGAATRKQAKRAVQAVQKGLESESLRYDELAWALSAQLDGRVGQVYITTYPCDPFHDDKGRRRGCGAMDLVSEEEAQFIFAKGTELNRIIENAAERHGWRAVTGLTDMFQGHGYCCSDSWYIGLEKSLAEELSVDGTLHPNQEGHKAIAGKIVQTIRTQGPVEHAPVEVTVDLEKVLIVDGTTAESLAGPPPTPVRFAINNVWVRTPPLEIGREHSFSPGQFRVRCVVGNGLAGVASVQVSASLLPEETKPRRAHANTDPEEAPREVRAVGEFGRSDGYGAGAHRTASENIVTGRIEATYTITTRPRPLVAPGSGRDERERAQARTA